MSYPTIRNQYHIPAGTTSVSVSYETGDYIAVGLWNAPTVMSAHMDDITFYIGGWGIASSSGSGILTVNDGTPSGNCYGTFVWVVQNATYAVCYDSSPFGYESEQPLLLAGALTTSSSSPTFTDSLGYTTLNGVSDYGVYDGTGLYQFYFNSTGIPQGLTGVLTAPDSHLYSFEFTNSGTGPQSPPVMAGPCGPVGG